MSSILPYKTAIELLEILNIDIKEEIDLDFIIKSLNIRLRQANLKKGILGASKVIGMDKLIVISQELNNIGRKRFTIAHELGHVLMHQGFNYCCSTDFNIRITKKEKEQQANEFASELLLPRKIMLQELEHSDVSFKLVSKLCNHYNTSLIATIIRLTQLTKDNIILIYHKNNRIIWNYNSEQAPCIENKNMDLSRIEVKKDIDVKKVDINYWIEDGELECFESTRYFRNYDEYLTIIEFVE